LRFKLGQGLDFESKADSNTAENALDLGTIKGGYHWSNLAISPLEILTGLNLASLTQVII